VWAVEIYRRFGGMPIYPEKGTGGAVTVFWYVTPCGLVITFFFRIHCLSRFDKTQQIPYYLSDDGNKFSFRNSSFNQKETMENNIQCVLFVDLRMAAVTVRASSYRDT